MDIFTNKVFIATSLDGYIADQSYGIDWLDTIPELNTIDTGYHEFTADIDAIVMGRNTFETVCNFDIDWPYQKPVYVVSNKLKEVSLKYRNKVFLIKGALPNILKQIHRVGHHKLYIDGGALIQSFLKEDLIDEMVITTIPVLLGGGVPLFGKQSNSIRFDCKETRLFLDSVVQNKFIRKR